MKPIVVLRENARPTFGEPLGAAGRQHHDWDGRRDAHATAEFHAVHVRQSEIEDDEIGRLRACGGQGFFAARGDVDVVAARSQQRSERPLNRDLVVDQEDSRAVSSTFAWRSRSRAAADRFVAMTLTAKNVNRATQFCGSAILNVPNGGMKK